TGLRGAVNLPAQWAIAEEQSAIHGKTMNRQDWRLVIPVHIAESRKEAFDDCRKGAARWQREYFVRTLGRRFPTDFPADEGLDPPLSSDQRRAPRWARGIARTGVSQPRSVAVKLALKLSGARLQ